MTGHRRWCPWWCAPVRWHPTWPGPSAGIQAGWWSTVVPSLPTSPWARCCGTAPWSPGVRPRRWRPPAPRRLLPTPLLLPPAPPWCWRGSTAARCSRPVPPPAGWPSARSRGWVRSPRWCPQRCSPVGCPGAGRRCRLRRRPPPCLRRRHLRRRRSPRPTTAACWWWSWVCPRRRPWRCSCHRWPGRSPCSHRSARRPAGPRPGGGTAVTSGGRWPGVIATWPRTGPSWPRRPAPRPAVGGRCSVTPPGGGNAWPSARRGCGASVPVPTSPSRWWWAWGTCHGCTPANRSSTPGAPPSGSPSPRWWWRSPRVTRWAWWAPVAPLSPGRWWGRSAPASVRRISRWSSGRRPRRRWAVRAGCRTPSAPRGRSPRWWWRGQPTAGCPPGHGHWSWPTRPRSSRPAVGWCSTSTPPVVSWCTGSMRAAPSPVGWWGWAPPASGPGATRSRRCSTSRRPRWRCPRSCRCIVSSARGPTRRRSHAAWRGGGIGPPGRAVGGPFPPPWGRAWTGPRWCSTWWPTGRMPWWPAPPGRARANCCAPWWWRSLPPNPRSGSASCWWTSRAAARSTRSQASPTWRGWSPISTGPRPVPGPGVPSHRSPPRCFVERSICAPTVSAMWLTCRPMPGCRAWWW